MSSHMTAGDWENLFEVYNHNQEEMIKILKELAPLVERYEEVKSRCSIQYIAEKFDIPQSTAKYRLMGEGINSYQHRLPHGFNLPSVYYHREITRK